MYLSNLICMKIQLVPLHIILKILLNLLSTNSPHVYNVHRRLHEKWKLKKVFWLGMDGKMLSINKQQAINMEVHFIKLVNWWK